MFIQFIAQFRTLCHWLISWLNVVIAVGALLPTGTSSMSVLCAKGRLPLVNYKVSSCQVAALNVTKNWLKNRENRVMFAGRATRFMLTVAVDIKELIP